MRFLYLSMKEYDMANRDLGVFSEAFILLAIFANPMKVFKCFTTLNASGVVFVAA